MSNSIRTFWRIELPPSPTRSEVLLLAELLGMETYGLSRLDEPVVGLRRLDDGAAGVSLLRLLRPESAENPWFVDATSSGDEATADFEGVRQQALNVVGLLAERRAARQASDPPPPSTDAADVATSIDFATIAHQSLLEKGVLPRRANSASSISVHDLRRILDRYGTQPGGLDSTEVQIAIVARRIVKLTSYLRRHKHDAGAQKELLLLRGRRSRMLRFLAKNHPDRYQAFVSPTSSRLRAL